MNSNKPTTKKHSSRGKLYSPTLASILFPLPVCHHFSTLQRYLIQEEETEWKKSVPLTESLRTVQFFSVLLSQMQSS